MESTSIRTKRRTLGVLAAAAASVLMPLPARAATHVVGPQPPALSLAQALEQAQDDDVVALLPGTYESAGHLVRQKRLTIRALDGRAVLKAAPGMLRNGKGLLVVDGADVLVQGLEFKGARAVDANGAGIRHQRGKLTVRDCVFLDNEMGILSADTPEAELAVEDSEFGMAPRIEGGLHHLLYVGRIGKFVLRGTRFYTGFEGHLVKSRARENHIAYNLIVDGDEGEASYEIDLPNGGLAWIIGNVIGQGPRSQNPVMVAYGAEGAVWPRNGLYVSHNTFVGNPWPASWFVRVFADRVPNTDVRLINNITLGSGVLSPGADGHFAGNVWAFRRRAVQSIYTLDFTPTVASGWRGQAAAAGEGGGRSLVPTHEFVLPRGTRPLAPPAAWTPGAVQPR